MDEVDVVFLCLTDRCVYMLGSGVYERRLT